MGIIFEVVYPLVYAAIVFVAITAVIFFIIGATHLSSKIFSGRRMVLLQPSTILAYFALVVCFAGHVDHVNAQFFYAKGKCLNEANNGDPGCNAKEVTPPVTGIDGPSTCTRGTIIKINITLSMNFNAERFDLGIYLGLNGTSARTGTNTCLVQSLGPADAGPTVSNVDGDKCWDSAAGISTIVIKNADILCNDTDNSGKVTFKSCFVWKTKGPNTNCNDSSVLLSNPETVSSVPMFGLETSTRHLSQTISTLANNQSNAEMSMRKSKRRRYSNSTDLNSVEQSIQQPEWQPFPEPQQHPEWRSFQQPKW